MALRVSVEGGTGAGTRRPPAPAVTQGWAHVCKGKPDANGLPTGVILPGYCRNCPACYCRRPNL